MVGTGLPGEAPEIAGIHFEVLDIRDQVAVAHLVRRVDPGAIVHLAALSHVGTSWQRIAEHFQTNVVATAGVVAGAAGRRVLFASSAEVYGDVDAAEMPIDEDRPLAPANPYAFGKAAAELWVRSHGGVVVRCFNIIGRGQAASFALPTFARQLATIRHGLADPVLRVGNLEAVRDFVHVDDAIDGILVALERAADGSALNIASGVGSRLSEVVDQLIARAGVAVRIEHDPSRLRPAEAPHLVGDPRRLEALGWKRSHTLTDAIDDLLAEAHDLVTTEGDRP